MAPTGLRAFLRALTDSHTELAIHAAVAALVLVLGDVVLMALLAQFAPALHTQAANIPAPTRRWLVGAPSALIYLVVVGRRLWARVRQ